MRSRTSGARLLRAGCLALLVVVAALVNEPAWATFDYMGVTKGIPGIGPTPSPPDKVFGKEFSHDADYEITAVGVAGDPEQIVAWDGSGGVANGVDYSGTRPDYQMDGEGDDIDALANHRDALFTPLLEDRAHLIFSVDDLNHMVTFMGGVGGVAPIPTPSGAPGIMLKNSNIIGGSGEVSVELAHLAGANPMDFQTVWAKQADVNGMPLPNDVDGLEVWGPEPGPDGEAPLFSDANKYSLDIDALSDIPGGPGAVSVWNGGTKPGEGEPYIFHSAIVAAVTSAGPGGLGPLPATAFLPGAAAPIFGIDAINLDALIVEDRFDDRNKFQADDAGGNHDRILFSIRQIVDPMDPDGFYSTGSELWVLDATGAVTPLMHGGHLWDHDYATKTFGGLVGGEDNQFFAYDINALEVIGGTVVVPSPAAAWLLVIGVGPLAARRLRL